MAIFRSVFIDGTSLDVMVFLSPYFLVVELRVFIVGTSLDVRGVFISIFTCCAFSHFGRLWFEEMTASARSDGKL